MNEQTSEQEVNYVNVMLDLGRILQLQGAARQQGGDSAAQFLKEILEEGINHQAKTLPENAAMTEEEIEARALRLYEDYSQLMRMLKAFESERSHIHSKHEQLEALATALGFGGVVCLECLSIAAKLMLTNKVAVAPW